MTFRHEISHGLQSAKPFFISSIGESLTDSSPPKGNLLRERQSETAPMLFPFLVTFKKSTEPRIFLGSSRISRLLKSGEGNWQYSHLLPHRSVEDRKSV